MVFTPGIFELMFHEPMNELIFRYFRMMINLYSLYDVLAEYHLDQEKQILLSDGDNPQKCRFCGRTTPEVTFNKVAHALSHMVENRHLKSDYECDECNHLFSRYENDYSAYMNLYHTMFGVHGKKGIPKYRLHSEAFSKITNETNSIHILMKEDEDSLIEWKEEDKRNNSIKVKGERAYTPQNILKAIVKMGISIMPKNELPIFKTTIDWLMNKPVEGLIPKVIVRFYRNKRPYTSCWIIKRKDSVGQDIPLYMFILAYNGIVVQTPFPFVAEDKNLKGRNITIPLFPTILDKEQLPFLRDVITVAEIDKKYDEATINIKYRRVEETINQTKASESDDISIESK